MGDGGRMSVPHPAFPFTFIEDNFNFLFFSILLSFLFYFISKSMDL
jgi:hypothetical protein